MSQSAETEKMRGNVFRVQGGHPISGVIRPSGNKNEALPVLAAALLAAAAVLLLVRPLGGTDPAETPAPTPMEVASIDTAATAPPEFNLYQFDGFDPTDASDLPEDYQRLASLFFE